MNGPGHLPPLAQVDGATINLATLQQTVSAAVSMAKAGLGFRLFTLNLDHLVKLRENAAFRKAYAQAELITADGAPVAMLARRQHRAIRRTTGADLVEPLCAAAAREGVPVAFFGSDQRTLDRCQRILSRRYPGLHIAHAEAPPFGFDPTSPEAERAAARMAASGARIVFVAFGAPKQELFSAHMAKLTPELGFVCIGAALDFIAGSQIRAPVLFQTVGMEWFWRLLTNPQRMAKRYYLCARLFFGVLLREAVPKRTADVR